MRRFLLLATFVFCQSVIAQEQPHYFVPMPGDEQSVMGAAAANTGAVGMTAQKTDPGFRVTIVVPSSPAERAGLKIGDVITTIDGLSAASLSQTDFLRRLRKNPGDLLQLSLLKNTEQVQIAVPLATRAKVYPAEAKTPPSVFQMVFEGHAGISAAMSQVPSQSQSVIVWLLLANGDAAPVAVDDSKFFVLDGQGQQLRHMSLDEVKYSIQTWLAQNWRGGNYPPPTPPPPQHRYTITGTENGNYTFTEMGNIGTVSGSSSSTYSVQQQPDYNQAGYMLGYSLGLALRQRADRKHDEQIMKQAQQTLASWDSGYFKSQSPVIPGENRTGGILYWTGSTRQASGPFKVVVFLTNPGTGKDEMVKFEFR